MEIELVAKKELEEKFDEENDLEQKMNQKVSTVDIDIEMKKVKGHIFGPSLNEIKVGSEDYLR